MVAKSIQLGSRWTSPPDFGIERSRSHESTVMPMNIAIIAQNGRLGYEALLFAASLQKFNGHNDDIKLYVCTPIHNQLWHEDPDIRETDIAGRLEALGAEVVPFENATFGAEYPHSNKIYALEALPPKENFVFFDTDVLIKGDLGSVDADFAVPTGGYEVPVWPIMSKSSNTRSEIWGALYDRFDIPTKGWWRDTEDPDSTDRFPYFNGGCFYYRCPTVFANAFRHIAHSIERDPPAALEGQRLFPFLDQIALALTIGFLNGDARGPKDIGLFAPVAFHYFSKPRLFIKPQDTGHLNLARQIVRSEELSDLFAQDPGFNYYFLEEGYDLVTGMVEEHNYNFMNFRLMRSALRKSGKWYK
ncbi:MAG: hypothetical protein AAF848_04595 [Pseudomonadota bacterium]